MHNFLFKKWDKMMVSGIKGTLLTAMSMRMKVTQSSPWLLIYILLKGMNSSVCNKNNG